MGGRYCHQTSTLFKIITKQIHHSHTTKKGKMRQKMTIITWKYTKEKNQGNKNYIDRRTYIQKNKKNIHNNNKMRNLYTGINIHPTQAHMIAQPFDSSVRMK